jgi:hypothetical protein
MAQTRGGFLACGAVTTGNGPTPRESQLGFDEGGASVACGNPENNSAQRAQEREKQGSKRNCRRMSRCLAPNESLL